MATPDTPLFVKTQDFILWLIQHTQRFPKRLRQSYTTRLESTAFDFQECILMANAVRGPRRADLLDAADGKLLFLRELLRLAAALEGLRLRLHKSKTQVRPTHAGVKFLGFVLRPEQRRLQQSAIRRFNRRRRRMQREFQRGTKATADIRSSLQAWLAHISIANSEGIRRELWRRLVFRKDSDKKGS